VSIRLAIDAASDRLSLAADRAGGPTVEVNLQGARRHAGALLPLIDGLLARLDAGIPDLALVAVADGPGSFTGLRVSFAAAKVLAAEGAALVTAPSLLVRAASAGLEASTSHGLTALAVASALRGELYAGVWHFDAGGIHTRLEPRTITAADIPALPNYDRGVGDGPEELLTVLRVMRAWPDARTLLRLIGVPGGARPIDSPATFEPHYGRPAEAAAKWEREHGRPLPDPSRHTG